MQTSSFKRAKSRPIRLSAIYHSRKICFLPHKGTVLTTPKSMFSCKFCQFFLPKGGDLLPSRVIGQQHALRKSNLRR